MWLVALSGLQTSVPGTAASMDLLHRARGLARFQPIKMTDRSHSAAFQRQAAEEFIPGQTLQALLQRHDISRQ